MTRWTARIVPVAVHTHLGDCLPRLAWRTRIFHTTVSPTVARVRRHNSDACLDTPYLDIPTIRAVPCTTIRRPPRHTSQLRRPQYKPSEHRQSVVTNLTRSTTIHSPSYLSGSGETASGTPDGYAQPAAPLGPARAPSSGTGMPTRGYRGKGKRSRMGDVFNAIDYYGRFMEGTSSHLVLGSGD